MIDFADIRALESFIAHRTSSNTEILACWKNLKKNIIETNQALAEATRLLRGWLEEYDNGNVLVPGKSTTINRDDFKHGKIESESK